MAAAETSQVTITLGRTGQVVKRGGGAAAVLFDRNRSNSEAIIIPGTKRPSVRDRLGAAHHTNTNNKRLRGPADDDHATWNFNSNTLDELRLSKDDLRFKIIKHTQILDLRDMLSRSTRPSTANSYSTRETRQGILDPRDDRPHGPVSRDDGLVSRGDRQRMAEPLDGRQGMPEPRVVRDRAPKLYDVRPHVTERPASGMTGQYTSLTTSYSPWTLDHIRRKSPDTRGISPQRRRAYEDTRSVVYDNRDASENSRPVAPTTFLSKPSPSVGPMKSLGAAPFVAPTLPPRGNVQRSQYPVEPITVEGFLRSLGLEKYLISFKVEEVDMSALSQMGDRDLKELGIPMGPRKKILLAVLARSESGRQAR